MIAGLILAGGKGERLGGADKALAPLAGAPLIGWVQARLGPQVEALAVSARGDPARFGFLGLAVLPDPPEAGEADWGPVAGVVSGLRWAETIAAEWLVTTPAAVIGRHGGLEPPFAAYRVDHRQVIEGLVEAGERSLAGLLRRLGAFVRAAPEGEDLAWTNLNTSADFAAAEALIAEHDLRPPHFVAL
jgi:molybdopterin-guanine dinucleotide biosynthesis protein A